MTDMIEMKFWPDTIEGNNALRQIKAFALSLFHAAARSGRRPAGGIYIAAPLIPVLGSR